MTEIDMEPKNVVMEYIKALGSQDYDHASSLIDDSVRIIGPAGENFGKPKEFTNMLSRYRGSYSILRLFADGEDVSLLYDFETPDKKVYMSSWYKVRNGKITFIRTVFDPSAFA